MPSVGNIYCIGRNYILHAKELNNPVPEKPVVFLKSNSSIRSLKSDKLAFSDEVFHFEGEIVIKIGRDVALGESIDAGVISEIALGIDLTRRGVQGKLKEKGLPWTTSKSFAGSALISDFTDITMFHDVNNISFSLAVNGETRQQGNTGEMLFSIDMILAYLASFNTLRKGDLIFTGTPAGVGEISKGDEFVLEFNHNNLKFEGIL